MTRQIQVTMSDALYEKLFGEVVRTQASLSKVMTLALSMHLDGRDRARRRQEARAAKKEA